MPIKLIFPFIAFCTCGILPVHATPFIINYQTLDIANLNVKSYKDKKMDETQGAWVANAVGGLAGSGAHAWATNTGKSHKF